MGKERTAAMNGSAERLAEATLGSWEAVVDAAARQQERAARFALGWIEKSIGMLKEQAEANVRLMKTLTEQSEKQAEALRILTSESTEVLTELLFSPLPSSRQEVEVAQEAPRSKDAREDGGRSPVEDYDRLSIEEISRRLEGLSPSGHPKPAKTSAEERKTKKMRAMLCHCHCHLEATDDQSLLSVLRDHLFREHSAAAPSEEQLRKTVATHAYELHYALVGYENGIGPDKEFGPNPY
jgi:hypothetical protein